MNAFVQHPLVILLIDLEAFSYMMTCEITISVGALFVLLGAIVSKLFTHWTIYASKVTFSFLLFMSLSSNSDSLRLKAKVLSD